MKRREFIQGLAALTTFAVLKERTAFAQTPAQAPDLRAVEQMRAKIGRAHV